MTDRQNSRADSLRAVADFLDANPDLDDVYGTDTTLYVFADDAPHMAQLARSIGGSWDKTKTGDAYYNLERYFGNGVKFQITCPRSSVCERIVTGTRTVTVPDPQAEDTRPMVEIEEDVVEWICPESLLALESESVS